MINDVPGELNRVGRLFRDGFVPDFDRYRRCAAGACGGGSSARSRRDHSGARDAAAEIRGRAQRCADLPVRFPKALLLADMKTMDGGEGEANAVYSGGGNVIDFLALAGEATARAVCAVRDTFRQADPAIPRLAFADVLIPMQGPAGPAVQTAERMLVAGVDGLGIHLQYDARRADPTICDGSYLNEVACAVFESVGDGRPCRWWAASARSMPSLWPAKGCAPSSSAAISACQTPGRATASRAMKSNDTSGISLTSFRCRSKGAALSADVVLHFIMLISLRCRFRAAVSADYDGEPCAPQRPMRENIQAARARLTRRYRPEVRFELFRRRSLRFRFLRSLESK